MISFKQFIQEATAKHFSHIGLDPQNPEHNDLIDAYNSAHSANDKSVPRNPGQIKSLEHLKSVTAPYLEKQQAKKQEKLDDKNAFESGNANLIHHNPETGLKIFQVHNQQGSCAAGAPSTWCTGHRTPDVDMVHHYDPEGKQSFIFKSPKEEKPENRTIGQYGKFTGSSDISANFQNAENHTVSDHDWNDYINRHKLHNVKHLKGLVRGIPITDQEKVQYAKELNSNSNKINLADLHHAISNNYLSDEHKHKILTNKDIDPKILSQLAINSDDPEIHNKILNHKDTNDDVLSKIPTHTNIELHNKILNHPNIGTKTLNQLAINSDDPEIHDKILKHKNINDDVLAHMTSENAELNDKILNHEKAGDNTLAALVHHNSFNDIKLHKKLLADPRSGINTINSIAHISNDTNIGRDILNHKDINAKTLLHLTKNKKLFNDIINRNDVDDSILGGLAHNTNDASKHNKILNHEKAGKITIDSVAANTSDNDVVKRILKNKNSDISTLNNFTIHNKNMEMPEVQKAILNNKDSDDGLIAQLSHYVNPELHDKIINHHNAGESTLDNLSKLSIDPKIHKKILNHPELSMYHIEHSIENVNDPELHKLVLDKFGHTFYNNQLSKITKQHNLNNIEIPYDDNEYSDVTDKNLNKVKSELSKKIARKKEVQKNKELDYNTREPLVTPIKARQKKYNFMENYVNKLKDIT